MQLENKLRETKNINKIIIDKREIKKARKIKVKIRETKIKTKIIEISTEANAKIDTKIIIATTTIIVNRKYLLKLRKQFIYIYISFIFKIVLILLSYLLLFNNL